MSSSPNESISDFDDAASTKKRGRDQSVEPQEPTNITQKEVEDNQPTSSAPKKSKRIDEEDLDSTTTTSVRTIRRNLKDMSTADRSNPTSDNEPEDATMHHDEDEQDSTMHQDQKEDNSHILNNSDNSIPAETGIKENQQSIKEEPVSTEQQQDEQLASGKEEEEKTSKNKHAFAAFGGGSSHDDDDWGEFEEDDKEEQEKKEQEATDKPKYTFGSTSGFGTKGWSLQQTATPPVTQTTQKPTFGGFSGSGFGAFASSEKPSSSFSSLATSSTINSTNNNNNNNNNNPPTFGSFSSFARAAAASKSTSTTLNDVNTSLSSPQTKESNELSNAKYNTEDDNNNSNKEKNNETSHSSTTSQHNATLTAELPSAVIDMNTINTYNNNTIKSKPLQQPPTEVITGEEDEDTLYQTRAKLYEMEQNNWKERGLGTLRIKQHKKNTQQRRVIMRADSVYRLILNVRLVSYLKFDINQEKFVQFLLIEKEENSEGKIENRFRKFALKVSNAAVAEELLHQLVSALPKEMDEGH